ncbi:hypothetical protein QJS10_CPB22g01402 [Acorus calamus]|uniref:Uncharacterized protein n=1 Tax=Acorus calamus TaxID=4465 RepID=A0AAV9C087_ACOCL|nr:hypothetical protein QJS10_CPB22g01402 [Acorus calamus]
MLDGIETVECDSPGVEEMMACPICLENLTEESEKDDEKWMEKKRTCPMCQFKMPLHKIILVESDQLIWTCETDFKNFMHVTPPDQRSS